ncbi:hypothetical protein ScPMuIL_012375 [Solemya velum]
MDMAENTNQNGMSSATVGKSGLLDLKNEHVKDMEEDVLYHLALSDKTHDLKDMFHDVKFVCFGGSTSRMKQLAEYMVDKLHYKLPAGHTLSNIAGSSDRYVLYKVGPVLSVSHGMGIPSLSILFHEVVKLLYHAGCKDVTFFRLGTSGGLGLEPGTVVISDSVVDGLLRPYMEMVTLGTLVQYPALFDPILCQELMDISADFDFPTVTGKTMCTYDFYEGQARLDGAFCDYSEDDKMAFLKQLYDKGVRNIEMESLCFAAMAHRGGIKCAVLCCTLLDRLKGDQLTSSHELMNEWGTRPQKIVAEYICKTLGIE